MPLTSYCKKCAQDVPVASVCPHCGAKLPASAVRLAWCVEHTPVKDWMCWNSIMRLMLPMAAAVLVLVVVLEGFVSGAEGVGQLISGGLLPTLAALLALVTAVLLLILILQGEDLLDCVVDSKGVHVLQYLPEPTPLKILLRLKSPSCMEQVTEEEPLLLISQRDVAWKDIARVQLWPEKLLVLFYAPGWWMRLSLPCTPFTWADALGMIQDKLGRKKGVILPPELTAPPKPKAKKQAASHQIAMDELPVQTESTVEEGEHPDDFASLADVLAELKEAEEHTHKRGDEHAH